MRNVFVAETLVARHGSSLFRHVLFIAGDTFVNFDSDFIMLAVAVVVGVTSASVEVVPC